jgi:hypothetical protein
MKGFAKKDNGGPPWQLKESFSCGQVKVATVVVGRFGEGNGNGEDRAVVFMQTKLSCVNGE